MNQKIIFASMTWGIPEVRFTSAFHLRKVVNEVNGKSILTSNFYNDLLNQPYLHQERDLIEDFTDNYPIPYSKVVAELKSKGAVKRERPTLLTEQAVRSIFYVYNIDPETLLEGGPKVPVKQNSLFTSIPQQEEIPEVQKKANALFPKTDKKKRQKQTGGRLTRLHKPGVNIGDETTHKLINLSKPLMPLVYKIPHIAEMYNLGFTIVRADMTVAEVEGELLFGIRFHEDGDYEFTLKRVNVDEIGIQNISIDKKTTRRIFDKALKFFKRHKLLRTALFDPQIAGDTIMFTLEKER